MFPEEPSGQVTTPTGKQLIYIIGCVQSDGIAPASLLTRETAGN